MATPLIVFFTLVALLAVIWIVCGMVAVNLKNKKIVSDVATGITVFIGIMGFIAFVLYYHLNA